VGVDDRARGETAVERLRRQHQPRGAPDQRVLRKGRLAADLVEKRPLGLAQEPALARSAVDALADRTARQQSAMRSKAARFDGRSDFNHAAIIRETSPNRKITRIISMCYAGIRQIAPDSYVSPLASFAAARSA